MVDTKLSIQEDFPPVSYDQWRKLVEDSLKGAPFEKKLVARTYEGIDIQPIYTLSDRLGEGDTSGYPGITPYIRGSQALGASATGWDIRQEHLSPQPVAANAAVRADVLGGVTSILLALDHSVRIGCDPDSEQLSGDSGVDGLMAYHVNDLEVTFANVDLSETGVYLETGAAFLPASSLLIALWRRQGVSNEDVKGGFNADPLKVLACEGKLPTSLDSSLSQLADLAAWTNENYPQVSAVCVDSSPFHHAGADAAQDIAFALATGLQYLRSMLDFGMTIEDAARQINFRMSVGTHHFLSIAKLRAARQVWAQVVESCGGSPASAAMSLHVRLSDRVQTRLDPYVNLLRNTVGIFSAGIGGADVVTSVPFDSALGRSTEFSRRLARNTALVLQEEAHLNRVVDPAGGSWYLEQHTQQIAEKAWEIFQTVESQGGIVPALINGWIAQQIDASYGPRAKDIATRREGITGVSEFPDLEQAEIEHPVLDLEKIRAEAIQRAQSHRKETPAVVEISSTSSWITAAVEAAEGGATIGQISAALGFHKTPENITPLPSRSFAEPFEKLRDASDRWKESHGQRPQVFLANLGPLAHHTARTTYSKSFFEAGGFEVVSEDSFPDVAAATKAFSASGAKIAVICSSDKLYPDFIPTAVPQLKESGARTVIVAGRPGDHEQAWRDAGVDYFIYISCDVLSTLQSLLAEEGVI